MHATLSRQNSMNQHLLPIFLVPTLPFGHLGIGLGDVPQVHLWLLGTSIIKPLSTQM